MAGPMSAPNGQARLTTNGEFRRDQQAKGKLSTGKTRRAHTARETKKDAQ